MTKSVIYRTVLWLFTIVCAALILLLSLQPATQSSGLSTGLTATVLRWFSAYRNLPVDQQSAVLATVQVMVRELAHIGEYTVLGFFASWLARSYNRRVWRSLPFTALFAVADECVQEWCADGRAFQLIDLVKDWGGCLLGAAAIGLCFHIHQKIKNSPAS